MASARPPIIEQFLQVCGTTTSVLKAGDTTPHGTLLLIIPGNPGVAQYYDVFMRVLYEQTDKRYPVWCVSHAGHGTVPGFTSTDKGEDTFGLVGQIRHKLSFIGTYVPKDVRLVLIGHSIGCYMILRMLRHLDPSRVIKCALLFPTIERLAVTALGQRITPWLKRFYWLAPLSMYPIYLVPTSVKEMVLRWYFKSSKVPQSAVEATRKVANPRSISNIAYLGNQEMQNVVVADYDIIGRHLDKLMFYYGSRDHWCPVDYCRDMEERFPTADIVLCCRDFEHAFVLQSGAEMATVLWAWLSSKTNVIS